MHVAAGAPDPAAQLHQYVHADAPHTHGHEAHACCKPPAEPTLAEFEGAMREATQALQQAVDNINEALEELRYAEADAEDT